MKSTKALICTLTLGALAFAAGNALAVPGEFTISGTATGEKVTVSTATKYVQVFDKQSFKNKDVLALLANGTGQSWFTNKGSHLIYQPTYNSAASYWYEEDVSGIFWVTNTVSHDLYRLDEASTTNEYWSFIELDYYEGDLGFWSPTWYYSSALCENYADSVTETTSHLKVKELGSDAILYVHDYPYSFNYVNYGSYAFWYNSNAAVIRGPLTLTEELTSTSAKMGISLSGNGDGMFYDSEADEYVYPVLTGKAKWSLKETGLTISAAE
jgi:hypothetical protein